MFGVLNDLKAKLSVEDARMGLKTLGVHPVSLKHAYLELDLSNKGLSTAEICESFPNIIYLDISGNKITTLKNLDAMTALIQLNASKNQLRECLDFLPLHCNSETPTSSGHTYIGSMLTFADLSDNQITDVGSFIKKHPFLECLILKGNKIAVVSGLEDLKFLKVLDLSCNILPAIQGLHNLNIRELNLEGNKLTTLDGLATLNKLTSINVSKNFIESLQPLKHCSSLSYIDASENRILQIKEVAELRNLESLNILILQNNPCYRKDHYRLRVLFRLPKLKRLDMINASIEEKIRAFNLYKAPEGDLQSREKVFDKYLPNDEFVDYSTQQLPFDDEADAVENDGSDDFPMIDGVVMRGDESSLSQSQMQQLLQLEQDLAADDNSSHSSNLSLQEKISELPSLASMRKKVSSMSVGSNSSNRSLLGLIRADTTGSLGGLSRAGYAEMS